MQPALMQLSGPNRGQVEVFDKDVIRIGANPANDLVIDRALYPDAGARQAQIRRDESGFRLTVTAGGRVWVNGQQVSEAVLRRATWSNSGTTDLSSGSARVVAGRPVVLMGYPTGLEALIARADPATAQRLLSPDIPDQYVLADSTAALGLI